MIRVRTFPATDVNWQDNNQWEQSDDGHVDYEILLELKELYSVQPTSAGYVIMVHSKHNWEPADSLNKR